MAMTLPAPPRNRCLRCGAAIALSLLVLAGCASDRVGIRPGSYVAGQYAPPGPPHDPWGPYIAEAARRHDVPELWIREVMRVESGGRVDAISRAGAMGLMQLMPGTWEELRERYGLGDDPFHPRDNILAGAAYLREMYDRFGSPGFLAAYNAGPAAFERYLARQRPLPEETRRYVAAIAPRIAGTTPAQRAAPAVYAAAAIPTEIPPGLRPPPRPARPTELAQRPPTPPPWPAPPPVTAPLREPALARAATPPAPPPAPARFALIAAAHAAPALSAPVPAEIRGAWAIQVGAFQGHGPARQAIERARRAAPDLLADTRPVLVAVATQNGTLVRARLVGLSVGAAVAACQRVERAGQSCIALAPDAQG